MKKIMILTASTGGGHNQAAQSLGCVYKYHGYEVMIVDFLKETGKVVEKVVVGGYSILYSNLPTIYKGLYKYSNKKWLNSKISDYALKIFERKIYKAIIEQNPDLIIGTHPFIVNTICKLKKRQYLSTPFISVVTDFKAHRFYVNSYVDAYIAASEYTRLDMMGKGICRNKIYPYGIPIRQDFLQNNNINKRKYENNNFTILLMGGSMGYKAIEDVLKQIVSCRNKMKIIVVCGTNKELMKSIKVNYQSKVGNKEILVYGFTQDIPRLMEESHLLISKPGGLTVSEAIAKNLPMLIPYMLPGQEEENAEFLAEAGVARIVENIELIGLQIDKLIDKPYIIKKMKRNMGKLSSGYSLDSILTLSNDLINSYKANPYTLKRVK